jgi:hypothetical protein
MFSFVNLAPFELRYHEFHKAEPNDQLSGLDTGVSTSKDEPKYGNLYHILLSVSHLNRDVNSDVQRLRVCGTYTSLKAAKAAAHRCLFDAGYEKEWFTTFDTIDHPDHQVTFPSSTRGEVVRAVAPDGTLFSVSVVTSPNIRHYCPNEEDRIEGDLFHVLQTVVLYHVDESGETRETSIQGSFDSYESAKSFARSVIISDEDGITKQSFAEYSEAGPGEADCGFGENVIVHAIGPYGENFLVSVLKGQEMEAVRLAEAAMRMR